MLSTENFAKSWTKKYIKAVRKKQLLIGMTKDQVICIMRHPLDVNKSTGKWGVHEQWVYYGNRYLYFENGKLTSWQE